MSITETATPPALQSVADSGPRVHPPVLFAGTLLAGFLLQRLFPFTILPRGAAQTIGRVLAVMGLALGAASVRTMRSAGTPVQPERPSTTVVTEGPYRFTRNPIYLSMAILYSGLALAFNAAWPLLLLPSVLFAVTRGMIEREEEYLENRFGDRYRQYKERVRRWL